MPGFNGTGPNSEGPRTGRGDGNCTPDAKNDTDSETARPRRGLFQRLGRGLGLGRGRTGRGNGRGRGAGRRWTN